MKLWYRPIFAQAQSRKDLGAFLDDNVFEVMQHLCMLYMYPGHIAANHWRTEVHGNLCRCKKLKSNNKLPGPKFIYTATWLNNRTDLLLAVEAAEDHVKSAEVREDFDLEELERMCDSYFQKISEALSKATYVGGATVYRFLDEVGF